MTAPFLFNPMNSLGSRVNDFHLPTYARRHLMRAKFCGFGTLSKQDKPVIWQLQFSGCQILDPIVFEVVAGDCTKEYRNL